MILDPSINKIYYLSGNLGNKKYIELNDISNFSIQSAVATDNSLMLGMKDNGLYINSPYEVRVTFSRDYLFSDNILNFTGSDPISQLYFYNGKSYFLIKNLYLTNYSSSFSIGNLPTIQNSFVSYGEKICKIDFMNEDYETIQPEFDIPNLSSISISGMVGYYDEMPTDNVYEFNYSININRQPFYSIGQTAPIKVETIFPFSVQASVNSLATKEYKNYEISSYENINLKYKNFDILVSGNVKTSCFPIRNSILTETNFNLDSNSAMNIQRNYIGYYGL